MPPKKTTIVIPKKSVTIMQEKPKEKVIGSLVQEKKIQTAEGLSRSHLKQRQTR